MKNKTVIIDIDGCVFEHHGKGASYQWSELPTLLPHVSESFDFLEADGACIVLMTARPECCRADLEADLRLCGLFWHSLVMGVTSGPRYLINDAKPGADVTAYGITLKRNGGFNVEVI